MQNSSLTWPTTAQTIQSNADTVTSQVTAEANSAVGRLTALISDAEFTRHPLSTEAESLNGLRDDLENLLTQGQVLTVSPYQFEVGTSYESGQYLNPQSALEVLSKKLSDQVDKHRPTGILNCIFIMITESQLNSFATKLTNLTTILPFPEWCQVARQATALSTNSIDKLYQPAVISQPRFKPQANLNANPLRELLKQQGAQLATLESLANDKTNVIEKLQALAIKKENKLTDILSALNTLKAVSGNIYSQKITGSTQSVATQLNQLTAPNNNQHTVASLIISTEPLTFFEELLCSA